MTFFMYSISPWNYNTPPNTNKIINRSKLDSYLNDVKINFAKIYVTHKGQFCLTVLVVFDCHWRKSK